MSGNPAIDRAAERAKRRRCTCVHFTGTQNETCKAGIRYADVERENADPLTFPRRSMPCWVEDETFNSQKLDCPSRVLPTEEQLAEEDREIARRLENMVVARAAIIEFIKKEGQMKESIRGRIPCPVCKTGTLNFTRAGSYNGHVHARCTTEGCCAWME